MQAHQQPGLVNTTAALALTAFVLAASLALIAAAWFMVPHLLIRPIITIGTF